MAENMPVKTNVIDVFEGFELVHSITDVDSAHAAAQQFAEWWEDGLLARAFDNKAPILDADEIKKVVSREWAERYEFRRRYLDGAASVYPEDQPNARRDGYRATTVAVRDQISGMCRNAWMRAVNRMQADDRERAEGFAVTHADRYAEGLERVKSLTAKDRLRDEIMAVKDEAARRQLMAEYPELFNTRAAQQMAAADRAETHNADVRAWKVTRDHEAVPHMPATVSELAAE